MPAMNLSLHEAAAMLSSARMHGDGALRIARVHTDTRSLQPGDLFVALRGERFNAADFLPQAAAKGAVAALCEADAEAALRELGLPGLVVPQARQALAELAAGWRQRFDGPLIAVTGSNGKTTVTQMIAAILHAWHGDAALATQGNFNNDIGLPLTLLRLRLEHRVAVVELGMNHPGEIASLAKVARPTVALVNNAQREHQEFMASVEAVARENGTVFGALAAHGVAVFPAGDAHDAIWRALAQGRATLRFGDAQAGADVFTTSAEWHSDHWAVQAAAAQAELRFELHIAGRHNVRNALAATACALAAGAPMAAIEAGLGAFRPVKGRSRSFTLRVRGRPVTVIDDTYNANPDSVRAVIDVLAELSGPRLLVLGDMGEVGEQGPAFHAEIGQYARARGIERLLAHGPLAVHAAAAFGGGRHFEDMAALASAVGTHLASCASVAVKGSRFMRMERVLEALPTSADAKGESHHAA